METFSSPNSWPAVPAASQLAGLRKLKASSALKRPWTSFEPRSSKQNFMPKIFSIGMQSLTKGT